jgi:5-oxoprolinase (ATP-hydrolysing)
MSETGDKFKFAIDRGGTFTDVFAKCPGGKIRVLKLLSEDPQHYKDAPTEGIRRILQEVTIETCNRYVTFLVYHIHNHDLATEKV